MSLVYELAVQEDLNTGTETAQVTNPDGGHLTGTQIGLHSFAVGQIAVTATWDPGSIGPNASTSTTVSVPSAEPGDFVDVSFSSMAGFAQITGHIEVTNTVRVVLANNDEGGTSDLGSGTLSILVYKVRTE